MRAEIKTINDSEITLKMIDPLNEKKLEETEWRGRNFAYLELFDSRYSSPEQRKHYWALVGDIHDHTGKRKGLINLNMKALYMVEKDTNKEPSVAQGKMTQQEVAEWLQMIIEWMIEHDIPAQHPEGYVPADISKMMYVLTMNKKCVVCQKQPIEMAHFDGTVGMGRDRTKVDHTKSKFLALCHFHHREQHNIGETEFIDRYHLAPLKLGAEDLKKLGIQGKYPEEE